MKLTRRPEDQITARELEASAFLQKEAYILTLYEANRDQVEILHEGKKMVARCEACEGYELQIWYPEIERYADANLVDHFLALIPARLQFVSEARSRKL